MSIANIGSIKVDIPKKKYPRKVSIFSLVRAARIELASLAWKAGILAIIRRPQTLDIITLLCNNISIRYINDEFEPIF